MRERPVSPTVETYPLQYNASPSKNTQALKKYIKGNQENPIKIENSKAIPLRKHKFIDDGQNKNSEPLPQERDESSKRRLLVSGKNASSESTESNNSNGKSAISPISIVGSDQDQLAKYSSLTHSEYYNTQRVNIQEKQKGEVQTFRDDLNQNLQKLHYFIDKAEKAQIVRQSSPSQNRRRYHMSPENRLQMSDLIVLDQYKTIHEFSPRNQTLNNNIQVPESCQQNRKAYYLTQSNTQESSPLTTSHRQQPTKRSRKIRKGDVKKIKSSQSDIEEETRLLKLFESKYCKQREQPKTEDVVSDSKVQFIDYYKLQQQQRKQVLEQLQDMKQSQVSRQGPEQDLAQQNKKLQHDNKKLHSNNKHLHKKAVEYKCKLKILETQLHCQDEFQMAQNQRVDQMAQEREKLLNSLQEQEDQISNLKQLLSQSLATKIKYESIFKRLLDNDQCRNMVLDLMQA